MTIGGIDHEQHSDPVATPAPPADRGTVVLPWYQNPYNIVTLIVTAAILAGMVGWMVGASRSDEPHNAVDTGFLQDMREHHEQAWVMSLIYIDNPDTDPNLRVVAAQIMRGQAIEVGRMVELLADMDEQTYRDADVAPMLWMGMATNPGQMPGMATDAELDELAELEGRAADEFFVELMTDHHLGGIEMADYAAANGEHPRVRRMAEGMATGQQGEITEMADLLGRGG